MNKKSTTQIQELTKAQKDEANLYKHTILARIGCSPDMLDCPRAKSMMTPCVARDGSLAVYTTRAGYTACVGCEAGVAFLLNKERERSSQ